MNDIFVIAEAGINHNGSLELAKELIDMAVIAGCDAVKFQKKIARDMCSGKNEECYARDTLGKYYIFAI